MKPIEVEKTALKEDLDKKLGPSEAIEELNSWREKITSRIRAAQGLEEQEQIEKEAIEGIKLILKNTEKCNLFPKGWEKQNWDNLSLTIAILYYANNTSVFGLV